MTAVARPAAAFRFNLRTLFLVVTILGSVLGWLSVQLKWIHDRDEALRWLIDVRARQVAAEAGAPVPPKKGDYVRHAGIEAPWSLRILRELGVERLEVDQDWLDKDPRYSLNQLRALFPEAEVTATRHGPTEPGSRERLIILR